MNPQSLNGASLMETWSHKPLFMVLDLDGTIIRIIVDEAEFDVVQIAHFMARLMRELLTGISGETRTRLVRERAREIISRHKLIRL